MTIYHVGHVAKRLKTALQAVINSNTTAFLKSMTRANPKHVSRNEFIEFVPHFRDNSSDISLYQPSSQVESYCSVRMTRRLPRLRKKDESRLMKSEVIPAYSSPSAQNEDDWAVLPDKDKTG